MLDVADGTPSSLPDRPADVSCGSPGAPVTALDHAESSGNLAPSAVDDRFPDPPGNTHCLALDPDILDELEHLAGDGNLVNELAELFLADAEIQVTVLDGALARADSQSLSRAAHQLKGSAANVGAAELARLCALLPAGDDPLDEYTIAAALAAIRSELGRVRSAFSDRASLR
jgi:hypothetical protein